MENWLCPLSRLFKSCEPHSEKAICPRPNTNSRSSSQCIETIERLHTVCPLSCFFLFFGKLNYISHTLWLLSLNIHFSICYANLYSQHFMCQFKSSAHFYSTILPPLLLPSPPASNWLLDFKSLILFAVIDIRIFALRVHVQMCML